MRTALFLITCTIVIAATPEKKYQGEELLKTLDVFEQLHYAIEKYHVSGTNSFDELRQSSFQAFVGSLNDGSAYLAPMPASANNQDLVGKYVGIGVVISPSLVGYPIDAVYKDSPADKVGVRVGDSIWEIDGVKVAGNYSAREVQSIIRGKINTNIALTVIRRHLGKTWKHTFELVRGFVKQPPPYWVRMIEPDICYIRMDNFVQDKEYLELHKEINKFRDKINGIILDLRHNIGGRVTEAIGVADLFLPNNTLLFIEKNRKEELPMRLETKNKSLTAPLVVLVDERTASASEILAGAIKVHNRGVLVGMPTVGKGTMQMHLPLKDNGLLLITVAYYLLPNGNNINHEGLVPDIYSPTKYMERDELTNYHLSLKGLRPFSIEDLQLRTALSVLNVLMSGGKLEKSNPIDGSIFPQIYISFDG